jgi:hypothetical protein
VTLRTRTVVVLAVVAAIVVTGLVVLRQHDERLRRDGYAKAQKLKNDIDLRFPIGTSRAHFMEFADRWSGWHADSGNSHWISVGQVPSPVWSCGAWEVGVVVSFEQERVSATRVHSWGANCL